MLVLFETPLGFALYRYRNAKIPEDYTRDKVFTEHLRLEAFSKFVNNTQALKALSNIAASELSPELENFLRKQICDSEPLGVCDSKLSRTITEKCNIFCVHSEAVFEMMRDIRRHLDSCLSQAGYSNLLPSSLALSHAYSRRAVKFTTEKADATIIQAIKVVDDLDRELNVYALRIREWYGWHFPEMNQIVTDNIHYVNAVKVIGNRGNTARAALDSILPAKISEAIKEAEATSMGIEISEEDFYNIQQFCDQVLTLSAYRSELLNYLRSRMVSTAPNLTVLVGELVGARLIAHVGSLLNLAKQPGSTIQILGAEKALFRAMRRGKDTPKHGLIFQASLVGQSAPKLRGKISRILAAKCSLSARVDALGESSHAVVGTRGRKKVETRLRELEKKRNDRN